MAVNYEQVLEALHQQTQADIEKVDQLREQNRLAEEALTELRRNRQAEQQRMRLAFSTNDMLTGLLPEVLKVFKHVEEISRRLGELGRDIERVNDILLLLLTEKSPQKVEEALQDLQAEIDEREKGRRRLLRTHTRNLAILREQAAYHGTQPPLDLINEIEAEERAIKDLQKPPGE